MKNLLVILFIGFQSCIFAQGRAQVMDMRNKLIKTDSLFSIEKIAAGKKEYDFHTDSLETIYEQTKVLISKLGRNTKNPIMESTVLDEMARIACEGIRSITTSKSKSRNRIKKKLKRIFLGTACSFGLINYTSFDIDLVHPKGSFYYDKDGPDGGFNLYKGKYKQSPTDEEPEPKQIPVEKYTEKELSNIISRKLNNWRVAGSLRNKEIVAVGVYIVPRQVTFNKKRIPQARVVIIFGMKRFDLLLRDRKWKKKHVPPVSKT